MPSKTEGAVDDHIIGNSGRYEGGRGGLERVTVNLTPRSSAALELAVRLTGDTKTDTINRALQVYAYLEQVARNGGSVHVREAKGDEMERLKFL